MLFGIRRLLDAEDGGGGSLDFAEGPLLQGSGDDNGWCARVLLSTWN